MQRHGSLGKSEQGPELTWKASQSGTLEAKVLGEKGTNGPQIDISKWIKIKSRRTGLLSYRSRIINKSSF